MSVRFGRWVLASFMLFAWTACQGGPAGPAPLSTASLENTLWRLLEIGGKPAHVSPEGREVSFSLVAEQHRVQGFSGCNRMMGSYRLEGEHLNFEPLATTRMACPDAAAGEQEAAVLKALESSRRWRIEGERLELLDDSGQRLALFESLYLR